MKPKPWVALDLARAHSAVGAALTVWVGGRIAGAGWASWWLAPMAVAFLLSAAGNAYNDAADAAIDRINRPNRPIPRGAATPREARGLACVCASLAVLLAAPFGWVSLLGTLFSIPLIRLYTSHLKAIPLAGNVVVGLLTGMALGYGGLLAGNVPVVIAPAAVLGLLFGAREILKTIHDIPGDHAASSRTLATTIGPRATLACATACFGTAILLLGAWLPKHPASLTLLSTTALTCAALVAPLWHAPEDRNQLGRALRWSKAIGLLLLFLLSITQSHLG